MHDLNDVYEVAAGEETSKCKSFLRLLWKFFRCIFSHVTLVSLVVAYCVLGAYAFESLEAAHEIEVKESIKYVRSNITKQIWMITENSQVLIQENWTDEVVEELARFEKQLLEKMKKDGWDGIEEVTNVQWTFAGALFYSIIVITTIGYGHIAPKTQNGKVVTIFYAILGIPLMLLCLSNIGDVMASSFRFVYWKICCYVCTRPPKPRSRGTAAAAAAAAAAHRHVNATGLGGRSHSQRQSGYAMAPTVLPATNIGFNPSSSGYSSFRKSIRCSGNNPSRSRSPPPLPAGAAAGAAFNENIMPKSCYNDTITDCNKRYMRQSSAYEQSSSADGIIVSSASLSSPLPPLPPPPSPPSPDTHQTISASPRIIKIGSKTGIITTGASRSLDRKFNHAAASITSDAERTPVLFNKYAMDIAGAGTRRGGYAAAAANLHAMEENLSEVIRTNNVIDETVTTASRTTSRTTDDKKNKNNNNNKRRSSATIPPRRSRSVETAAAAASRPAAPVLMVNDRINNTNIDLDEINNMRKTPRITPSMVTRRPRRNPRSHKKEASSARIMSPMGFVVHRQTYIDDIDLDYDYFTSNIGDQQDADTSNNGGMIKPVPIWLCVFLVVSYIFGGAFLFAEWETWPYLDSAYFCFITLTTIGFGDLVPAHRLNAHQGIALCSLYLLFGIALLAMSFNLVQEEVINNVKNVAKRLGILKDDEYHGGGGGGGGGVGDNDDELYDYDDYHHHHHDIDDDDYEFQDDYHPFDQDDCYEPEYNARRNVADDRFPGINVPQQDFYPISR